MTGLLREGQIVRDTYEVERFLGEGAYAEVYRVKHRFLGRQAMKVFKKVGTLDETQEMLGEAILLSRIGHPNIIRVFDANTVTTAKGPCGFFTMEYVAGGSLESYWISHRERFVPIEDTLLILTQVCQGLAVAHEEHPPIIHRDIKPQNILVGYDAGGLRARISDFGLAKPVDPLTLLVSARGTLGFKAPETLRDPHADSRAGDVWALGTTAYLLLTDHLPFETPRGLESFLGDQFRQAPPSPSTFNPNVAPALDRIVLRMLERDPDDRPQSARALSKSSVSSPISRLGDRQSRRCPRVRPRRACSESPRRRTSRAPRRWPTRRSGLRIRRALSQRPPT